MIRSTLLAAALSVVSFAGPAPRVVQAGHEHPVRCAVDRYREAVREFERHVHRAGYVAHCDKRLIDQLGDSAARLRSAAHDLDRRDRLERFWGRYWETERLHQRVESLFFVERAYPHDPKLVHCWRPVAHAYQRLGVEVQRLEQCCAHCHHLVCQPSCPGYRGRPQHRSPQRFQSPSRYRSQYGPTFRPDSFGPGPALRGHAPRPALTPHKPLPPGWTRSAAGNDGGPVAGPGLRRGADLQRRGDLPAVSRQPASFGEHLGRALIGALLERR